MTTVLKGKTRAEAEALVDRFQKLVTGKMEPGSSTDDLGDSIAMAGVSQFPSRVKCATLGWHTAVAALHASDKAGSAK
jgi:nitrogen fixation NifU-like protein